MFYSCGHQACTRCTEQIITPHLTTFNLLTSIDRAVEIQMIETIKTIETQMCSLEHNMNQIIILIQNFIDEYTSQQLSYLEKNNNNVEYSTSSFEVLDHKAKFYNLQSIITEMHIDHTIIENICRFIDSTVEDFNKVNELMHLVTDQLAFQSA